MTLQQPEHCIYKGISVYLFSSKSSNGFVGCLSKISDCYTGRHSCMTLTISNGFQIHAPRNKADLKIMTRKSVASLYDSVCKCKSVSSHISRNFFATKIVSEYYQEIPQSQTADNPVALRGRAAQPSQDTRKTN